MKAVMSCVYLAMFCALLSYGQEKSPWAVTPPSNVYPVDPWTTAELKGVAGPGANVSMVLRSKPMHVATNASAIGPGKDIVVLELFIDVGDEDLVIAPTEWGKVCKGTSPHQVCTTGQIHSAGAKIDFSFDGGPTIHDRWTPGDGAAFFPGSHGNAVSETEFLDKLRTSKRLTVKYYAKGHDASPVVFDLAGTAEIIEKLCTPECSL